MIKYKTLFGPVFSRRLGVSLGVDMITPKTCSLNCVYCECGKTTNLTLERKIYIPTDLIVKEIDHFLATKPKLDYITLAGSGEPTLALNLGEVINYLKKKYPEYKVAVLTNSTLLADSKVQKELLKADLIVPSLDAVSKENFFKITRPQKKMNLEQMLKGLVSFAKKFKNQLWVEIFIVPGFNDQPEELAQIKKVLGQIPFQKIQLNTLDRPGTEGWVKTANSKDLAKIKKFLAPFPVEIASQLKNRKAALKKVENLSDHILKTIQRRPSTVQDLAHLFQSTDAKMQKILDKLAEKKILKKEKKERGIFYLMNKL